MWAVRDLRAMRSACATTPGEGADGRGGVLPPRARTVPQARATLCVAVVAAVLASLALTSCAPAQLTISASPGLFPAFTPAVTDYVSRCSRTAPVQLTVDVPDGSSVSVAGQPPRGGSFTAAVTRGTSQSFTIVSQSSAGSSTYVVRCLPADFPRWTTTRSGTPQAEWFGLAPISVASTAASGDYSALFDRNGVPVWWRRTDPHLFFTYLPNGHVAWTTNAGTIVEEGLDGRHVRVLKPPSGRLDIHELQLLANGNYLVATNLSRVVDLRPIGGPASATLDDPVIEELTPTGEVVWSWSTVDHIPVTESDPQWRTLALAAPYDVFHFNGIGTDGDGRVVLSYRHLDAVYDVDRSTGEIRWKLGGRARTGSLTISGDPVFAGGSGFGGQHDARMLADGTLTLSDNGTNRGRAPRAVRYSIATGGGTATMLEQVVDPANVRSRCCGSSRRLPGGNWVSSWGLTTTGLAPGYGSGLVAELTPAGARTFGLSFQDDFFSYRAIPLPPGQVARTALRAAMDKAYPPCDRPTGCRTDDHRARGPGAAARVPLPPL
ncbi:MAG: hypothetical protein JWN46_650 [Acidimicrobiales bacterium]|nr:hypothetical protein [Acidimicrobiales bacterium]